MGMVMICIGLRKFGRRFLYDVIGAVIYEDRASRSRAFWANHRTAWPDIVAPARNAGTRTMKLGIAFRYSTLSPPLIGRIVSKADEWGIPSLWFNDSQTPISTLEMCGVALGAARKAKVGT